jgi:hypothetical protein
VLAALGGAAAAARVLAARRDGPLSRETMRALMPGVPAARLTDRGSFYRVVAAGEVGEIRRGVEAVVRAPAGLEPEVVAWRPLPDAE